eukprot:PhF_6_TR42974/c0_g1_i1/m.65444
MLASINTQDRGALWLHPACDPIPTEECSKAIETPITEETKISLKELIANTSAVKNVSVVRSLEPFLSSEVRFAKVKELVDHTSEEEGKTLEPCSFRDLSSEDRLRILRYFLYEATVDGGYTSPNRTVIRMLAHAFGVSLADLSTLEHKALQESSNNMEQSANLAVVESIRAAEASHSNDVKAWLITGFTTAGAVVCLVTSFLAFPVLVQGFVAGGTALAAVGVNTGTAAALGAPTMVVATKAAFITSSTLGGAGLGAYRAVHLTSGCSEFNIYRVDRSGKETDT